MECPPFSPDSLLMLIRLWSQLPCGSSVPVKLPCQLVNSLTSVREILGTIGNGTVENLKQQVVWKV